MSLTLNEARTRSALISDVATAVRLDLRSTESFTVHARVAFTFTPAAGHAAGETFLELAEATEVHLQAPDGVSARYEAGRIHLGEVTAGRHEVTVRATLGYVTDGDGMTAVTDPADGERYVMAYTAMDIAQRVIPCFDQPDLKTTVELEVSAPEAWTVLANGALAEHTGEQWRFERTPPISSYLFFVAAGPWVSTTWQEPYAPAPGGSLDFGWHARASQADALARESDWLREVTSAAFAHYTATFTEPYAFADYQQVFSPGLNWGAMEFPGCVSFRDEFLTPGEPTTLQRSGLASVIAHEMAHMWFGDLVTMVWWEDSWLNESFADFMGYEVGGRATASDFWVDAALTRKPTAFQADSRRSTHPIAEDAENLVDVDTAFANFDMITYAKGNAVLRQLVTWLGEEDFLAGVNRHLSAHPFGNATLADFLGALDASSDRDVRGWAQSWLRTTGFDDLTLASGADGVPTLSRTGSRPHRLRVTGFDTDGAVAQEAVVDVAEEPVPLTEFVGLTVLPNSEDEAYAALQFSPTDWQALTDLLPRIASPRHRAVIWATALHRARYGSDSPRDFVALAAEHLRTEPDPTVFEAVTGLALHHLTTYAHPHDVADLSALLSDLAREVSASGPESHQAAAARLLAATGADAGLLRSWLAADSGLIATDQQLRWAVVTRLAELGESDHAGETDQRGGTGSGHQNLVEAELARDPSVAGQLAALRSRAAAPTREAKEWAWSMLSGGTATNRELSWLADGMWRTAQSDLLTEWVLRAPADLAALARKSGQGMGQLIGRALPSLPLATATLQDLVAAVEAELATGQVPTVAARQFDDRLDDLRQVLASR